MADNANNDVKDTTAEGGAASTESSTDETNSLSTDTTTESKLDFSQELEGETGTEPQNGATNEEANSEAEDRPNKGAEMRKQQLNTEIRDKVAERNALKHEIEELNRQKYQLKSRNDLPTVEQLLDEINPDTGDYFTRMEAQLLILQAERELDQQARQMEAYNNQLVESNMALINEAEKVIRDFPMFDPNSDEYDKDLTSQADELLDAALIRDPNTGRIISSQISPYKLYATIANAAGAAKKQGEVAGRKAAQKMMSSVDVVGGGVGPSSDDNDDPFAKGLKRARMNR